MYNLKRNENYVENTVKYPTQEQKEEINSKRVLSESNIKPLADNEPITFDDYWGDTNASVLGSTNGGVYYYYLNSDLIKAILNTDEKLRQMMVVPPVDAIQTLNYNPYLQGTDVLAKLMSFDTTRMPIPTDTEGGGSFLLNPYVFRLQKLIIQNKKVGAIRRFSKRPVGIVNRDYRMESKLQMSPYRYGILFDGVSEPFEFQFENFTNNANVQNVYVNQPITNMGNYSIYLDNYKGDVTGSLEGTISTRAMSLPMVSNAYINYMSGNQAQSRLQTISGVMNGVQGGITGGISGFATGGVGGAVVGGLSGIQSGAMQVAGVMAQKKDLKSTPNTLKSGGSDILFYKNFNNGYLNVFEYEISEQYKRLIGDQFAMYGYRQNKVFTPNLKSRYYYNYIKTIGVNLESNGIPKEHLQKIKDIFNQGVTIWHGDNKNVNIGDYSKDNYETYS